MHFSKASTMPKASLLLLLSRALCSPLAITVVNLSAQANSAARPIPKDMAALSIEFCYAKDYLGDVDSPNVLSLNLLQNIEDIVGNPPIIRLGGHTQDAASFCDGCPETLNNTFTPGNDEAIAVSYNRNFFTVLNENVPPRQEFIFGLN
ncbi:hypothetical protein V501_09191, partial [Pseudogymnoascus sp. VKM F-4519 (FW-2642)]